MDQPNTDVIQGTLDRLILKTLTHGFGIRRPIEQMSRGGEWCRTGNSRRSPAIARLLKAEA